MYFTMSQETKTQLNFFIKFAGLVLGAYIGVYVQSVHAKMERTYEFVIRHDESLISVWKQFEAEAAERQRMEERWDASRNKQIENNIKSYQDAP